MAVPQEKVALYVALAALLAAVFALDNATALGVADWVVYLAPLLLSLFATRPAVPLVVGVAAAAATIAGHFFSPASSSPEVNALAPYNRAMVVLGYLALGWFGQRFVAAKVRLIEEEWVKTGHARLGATVQGELALDVLADRVASFLAEYVRAPAVSIYAGSATLVHRGGFADAATAPALIRAREGLVGQAAAEGRLLVVEDLPDDYRVIRSAIGAARPRALLLLPVRAAGAVLGVVEIALLRRPDPIVLRFLESAGEAVATAIRSAEYRHRQAELLEETQRQAEELQAQQEELQLANAGLAERGRALGEANGRLQEQQAALEESNAQLEEQAAALELQKEHLAAAQEQLIRKAEELERTSRYKSEFLANMSHELRTPLNSALILARLLADNKEGTLSPEQVRYATNIYSAGNDLLALINDILDLSRIEAGKLELRIEPVRVADLLGALERRFAPLVAEKKLLLSIQVQSDCPATIETDAQRIQQVLTNLLSNAVKFTERGSVQLLAAASGADQLSITVIDTGPGIAPEHQQLIFEAFRQGDGTTSRRHGGTGLGLSISRDLSELLGGRIELHSQLGSGSRFTLRLPLKAPQQSAGRPRPRPVPAPPLQRTAPEPLPEAQPALPEGARAVVIIEDDPVFGGILRDLALEMRFFGLVARHAEDGLRLAAEIKPAAIVLDVGLPDHSGLAVLEALKRDPETRHIPIHVVSAHDYQQVARELGVVGYALKPVKREELVAGFLQLEGQLMRKSRRVLVVEDDAPQREAIAALLGGDGVTIVAANDAGEAAERLKTETFDCVVLDLMLPETSGFELLDQMAKDEAVSFPPVIVYTARALTLDEEQRLRRNARSIVIKGARSPERLLEEVTLFLHQVERDLPPQKRQLLRRSLDRDAALAGRRILIVEDDIRNVYALTSALEARGAQIEVARNGKEAVERLELDQPIDLVLMDVMMPELDGIRATQEIRRGSRASAVPIIALTAKAMPDDRQQCLAAGANDYIAKPIQLDRLMSLVRVWMPRP